MSKIEKIHIVTNEITGETISRTSNVIDIRVMEPEPAYIKLYIEDISRIFNLQQGHQEILAYVAASVDYEGIVSLAIGRKARIAATLNCSVKSIDNAITEYIKHGILARIGRGEYELDPNLFAKGKWRDIRERRMGFRTTITYTPKGREIVTAVI